MESAQRGLVHRCASLQVYRNVQAARKTQVAHKVVQVSRYHNNGALARLAAGQMGDHSQRWTVQVIEVGMGHQHGIDGRQIAETQPWTTEPFQHKDPAGKVRVNQNVLAADLQEEAGVPDESNSQLAVRGEPRFVRLSA